MRRWVASFAAHWRGQNASVAQNVRSFCFRMVCEAWGFNIFKGFLDEVALRNQPSGRF